MFQYSEKFLRELDRFRHREIYARIIALSFDELPLEQIEGRVTAGSINVDGNSAVRRTCSLTVVAEKFEYYEYIWGKNSKFKLEIGVKNFINPLYEDIIWFPQGIYVLSNFTVARSATNFTINISGKDKMCLLNGEFGGVLESSVDFGCIEEEDRNGNWITRKLPIQEIIKNAVHVYGREPYHNIIINDLDTYGVELLEYRYDMPMYLYRSGEEGASVIYTNAILEEDSIDLYIKKKDNSGYQKILVSQLDGYGANGNLIEDESLKNEMEGRIFLEPLITTLTNEGSSEVDVVYTRLEEGNSYVYTPWYFTKIEYGQTAGYRETDLVYPQDLISKVGESLTSILDKIKNMLVEFEYFYNLDGQFVFQRKKSFTSTMWTPDNSSAEDEILPKYLQEVPQYLFSGGELITAFNNNPNISNLKNDFSIWGERTGISGAKIPIHLRYSIAEKPLKYKQIKVYQSEVDPYNRKYNTTLKPQIDQITYKAADTYSYNDSKRTVECDWREIIYQMAKDYFKYNHLDNFEQKIIAANPEYPTGQTGYESYYTDIQGFWRELYYPGIEDDRQEEQDKRDTLAAEVELLQKEVYGEDVDWSNNKLGGIENDLQILNGYITSGEKMEITINGAKKEWPTAKVLIYYWNTKSNTYKISNVDAFSGAAPHYDFVDDEDNLITDVNIYLGMLQDLYFRKQSEYNTKKLEYDEQEIKYQKIQKQYEQDYYQSGNKKYWCKNIYEAPYLLNFWFDFLDNSGQLSKYCVQNVGNRPKAIQDNSVKSIYFRETPKIIFRDSTDPSTYEYVRKENLTSTTYTKGTYFLYENDSYVLATENYDSEKQYFEKIYKNLSGYKAIQVPSIESMFTISAQGKSAKESLDELLYQHSHSIETATITAIPIYHLEPNIRIKVADEETHLQGDYIINKITIPLTYNGTMSLTVTKAVSDII